MRCTEVEELAGAYALNALPRGEQAEMERHLAGCARHPSIASLRLTADALAMTAPEMEPPVALKARLMDAVRAEAAAPPQSVRRRATGQGLLDRIFGAFRTSAAGYGLAAALAVVVAVLLVSGGGRGEETVVRSFDSDGVSGRVVYVPDEDVAVMTVDGLSPPAEGKTYQVWAITEGTPASIGFLDVDSEGLATAAMQVELREGQIVAVTLEPAGGSAQPTTEPIFSAEI